MKIIRKRRGFSTNSSSSFEWVPPAATMNTMSTMSTGTAGPGALSATPNPATTATQTAQTVSLPTSPPAPFFSGNSPLVGIGIVGAIICGLFLVEEVIRRLWKRFMGKKHED